MLLWCFGFDLLLHDGYSSCWEISYCFLPYMRASISVLMMHLWFFLVDCNCCWKIFVSFYFSSYWTCKLIWVFLLAKCDTRTSSVPVVGWPPIRSFRKNLASSSLKPSVDSQNGVSQIKGKAEDGRKGMFIKINMDGVPIGRKIDLSAYHSYERLSSAVDELFRDLLKGYILELHVEDRCFPPLNSLIFLYSIEA